MFELLYFTSGINRCICFRGRSQRGVASHGVVSLRGLLGGRHASLGRFRLLRQTKSESKVSKWIERWPLPIKNYLKTKVFIKSVLTRVITSWQYDCNNIVELPLKRRLRSQYSLHTQFITIKSIFICYCSKKVVSVQAGRLRARRLT